MRAFVYVLAAAALMAQPPARRLLRIDDLANLAEVGDARVSPDGKWVAYTVTSMDLEADKQNSDIWMVSWDGSQNVRLTYAPESESSPRWSPDNRYLSFTSSRPGKAKGSQVWLLDRRGGEARQLTALKGEISDYEWSPDAKRLLLVMREKEEPDPEPAKPAAEQPKPKPIVIDRYHFKEDKEGYLGAKRDLLYLYEINSGKLEKLTSDQQFDEKSGRWSPDGSRIAFISNHDPDWDRTDNTDLFVIDAKAGSVPRRLTNYEGPDDGPPAWSPDGKLIAYVQGSEPKYDAYNMNRLAVVPAAGGPARILTSKLDRGVSSPEFSSDGRSVFVLIPDDRSDYPARVSIEDGSVERLVGGKLAVSRLSQAGGHTAVVLANDTAPPEIFALEGGSLRKLTAHNDALLAKINLSESEDITFRSKDGAEVHGLLTKPPFFESGKKYPLLLRIHGGPNWQDAHAFHFERQLFAAGGYLVLNINYRGSYGRGAAYTQSIFADWGDLEVADLLAGVDYVLSTGIADPARIGIGGWSYGGMLTDYVIASDKRFKAAISGAGSANQISMYGDDEYVFQYDMEIGPPWKNPQAWLKISYPFFKADRISTPTLFMGGDKDYNVPLIGSEQMYQALQTLKVPSQLVVYPGEFHEFTRPSFLKDRLERYLAWYGKYLKPEAPKEVRTSE